MAKLTEVSVYVSLHFSGQKIRNKLLEKLITESEHNGIWTLQSGIFPENKASLLIHEKLGFRQVGYQEKNGKRNEIWSDTTLLKRRSNTVGL